MFCNDADDGAEDVEAVVKDHSVRAQRIDKAHCPAVHASKGSQRRQIQRQENLGDKLGWDKIQSACRMLRSAVVLSVVKRIPRFEAGIVQSVVDDSRLAITVLFELVWGGNCCTHAGDGSDGERGRGVGVKWCLSKTSGDLLSAFPWTFRFEFGALLLSHSHLSGRHGIQRTLAAIQRSSLSRSMSTASVDSLADGQAPQRTRGPAQKGHTRGTDSQPWQPGSTTLNTSAM